MTTSKPFTMITIGLLITSLISLTASVSKDHHESVVVKADHHRVVVVEYDNDPDGSTRVSVSPHDRSGPKDTTTNPVCDAYGKCKHIIANAVTKPVHWVSNKAQEDAVNEAITNLPHDLRETKEKLLDHGNIAHGVSKVKEVASDVMGTVKDGVSKAKNFDVVDSPKRIVEDISWNVTRSVKESVEQVKEQTEESVTSVREICRKSLNEVVTKVKQVTYDVVWYVLYCDGIGSVAGLVHMLGFSTAYGMCVWVTFVSSYILGRCLTREMFGMVQSRIYPVYFRAMACCVSAALLGLLVSQKREGLTSKIGMVQSLSLGSALLMVLINMMLLEPKATKAIYKRMKLEKKEGRGVRVAVPPKDGMVATVVSTANRRGVRVAAAARDGMTDGSALAKDGMTDGNAAEMEISATNGKARDVLMLNEKLKRLNAYSSALNLFTLVALTWHMAYTGQRLQAR